MDEERREEITRMLLKIRMAEELCLADIAVSLEREANDVFKGMGIPKDEFLEIVQPIVREIFEDQMEILKSRTQALD